MAIGGRSALSSVNWVASLRHSPPRMCDCIRVSVADRCALTAARNCSPRSNSSRKSPKWRSPGRGGPRPPACARANAASTALAIELNGPSGLDARRAVERRRDPAWRCRRAGRSCRRVRAAAANGAQVGLFVGAAARSDGSGGSATCPERGDPAAGAVAAVSLTNVTPWTSATNSSRFGTPSNSLQPPGDGRRTAPRSRSRPRARPGHWRCHDPRAGRGWPGRSNACCAPPRRQTNWPPFHQAPSSPAIARPKGHDPGRRLRAARQLSGSSALTIRIVVWALVAGDAAFGGGVVGESVVVVEVIFGDVGQHGDVRRQPVLDQRLQLPARELDHHRRRPA